MLEAHPLDRFRDPHRLAEVEHGGPAGLDGTEAAGARAGIAQDHEGGGAGLPALADVGAAGLFAHRMQLEAAHDPFQLGVVPPAG